MIQFMIHPLSFLDGVVISALPSLLDPCWQFHQLVNDVVRLPVQGFWVNIPSVEEDGVQPCVDGPGNVRVVDIYE